MKSNLQNNPHITLVTFITVALLYVIGLINGRTGFLVTTSSQVNYAVMLGIHGLPLILFGVACLHPGWKMKLTLLLLSIPLVMVVSTTMGLMTALTLYDISKNGEDHSFKQIHTVGLPHSRVRVYRTNGGATTSFGIVVRQERPLISGLVVTKNVYAAYPAYDAEVTAVGPNKITISVPPNEPFSRPESVQLKPFVYF